jgi:hypothetical protein
MEAIVDPFRAVGQNLAINGVRATDRPRNVAAVTKLLLSIHVLAAIIAIGPVTVAASLFPRAVRQGDGPATGLLHRVTRTYAVVAIVVPVFGVATALALGVLTDGWLLIAMALTAVAAIVLIGVVLPGQRELMVPGEAVAPDRATIARLGMATGIFNLLWAVVVVLMIVRPGSTTGA